MKNKIILIVGFGAIGCRHAQSLLEEGFDNIYLYDTCKDIINDNMKLIGYNLSEVKIVNSLDDLDSDYIDLAIISTSSYHRFDIFNKLVMKNIKYFLLEKIVFQSMEEFRKANEIICDNELFAYCNFPNRYFINYTQLRKKIKLSSKSDFYISSGDCGIACSGIHYLDLFEYLTCSSIIESKSYLEKWSKNNKRGNNYIDFSGVLCARNENKNNIELFFDKSHNGGTMIKILLDDETVLLSETDSSYYSIKKNNEIIISQTLNIKPQSKLTSKLVEDIFSHNALIPTINESRNAHYHLFKECQKAINQNYTIDSKCPVT
tara:strand:+ start:8978 stop:9934 length:957 start_codon:yes stop_codon:yes gene_type:complete